MAHDQQAEYHTQRSCANVWRPYTRRPPGFPTRRARSGCASRGSSRNRAASWPSRPAGSGLLRRRAGRAPARAGRRTGTPGTAHRATRPAPLSWRRTPERSVRETCADYLTAAREVALSGARLHPRAVHLHLERVHLPVERRRREAERVLVMQLVGDTGEGGREIVRRRELEVPAAGGRRDRRQPCVRLVDERRGRTPERPRPPKARRAATASRPRPMPPLAGASPMA